MTRVSVIVPVYNVDKYLTKALKSLKGQSLADAEFICINNGSEDKSSEILNNFGREDNRFIVVEHEKRPIGTVRNEGIDLAKGDYIAFMDSDDTFERTALDELYSQAEQQKTDMILYNYREVDENYKPIENGEKQIAEYVKDCTDLSDGEVFNWLKIKTKVFGLGGAFWSAWCKFYNASFLKNNNIKFSDSNYGEDHIFTVKSILKANNIGYKEPPIYNYMRRTGSASRPVKPNLKNEYLINVFKQVKDFLVNIGLQNELKQEFNQYVASEVIRALPKSESQNELKKRAAEVLLK